MASFSKAIIENCHPGRISVRIWVSANLSSWSDRGILASQYTNSGCPFTGTPKTIEFSDNTSYRIIAMHPNCGSESPVTADATCRVLETPGLNGNGASPNVYLVQLGTGQQL